MLERNVSLCLRITRLWMSAGCQSLNMGNHYLPTACSFHSLGRIGYLPSTISLAISRWHPLVLAERTLQERGEAITSKRIGDPIVEAEGRPHAEVGRVEDAAAALGTITLRGTVRAKTRQETSNAGGAMTRKWLGEVGRRLSG